MKKIFAVFFILFCFSEKAQIKTGEELITKMWNKYHGKTAATVSFTQTTKTYGKDSVAKTSIWYEHLKYPDKFRIDVDSFPSSKMYILRDDMKYILNRGRISVPEKDKAGLLLILGGMYYRKLPDVMGRLKELNLDFSFFKDSLYENLNCYVIGKDSSSQIYIEKEFFRIKRILLFDENGRAEFDARIEEWQRSGKGWMEKKLTFYEGNKKLQSEEYNNTKAQYFD